MRVTKEFEKGRALAFSLWVTVDRGERTHVFEFDGQSSRAVVIGSTRDTTHAVYEPELAPIECFLEREGDEIWLVPGTPSSPLRVDGIKVDRPIRLWRRCSLEVSHYCYVVRVREEPPTARDLEIPGRRGEQRAQGFHASGTLCGGFDVASLGVREAASPMQQLPPGVAEWRPEAEQAIPVCEIVAVGSVERDGEPRIPSSLGESSGSGASLTEQGDRANPSTPAPSQAWQRSVRSTDVGLMPPVSYREPMLSGAQPGSVPFRPLGTPYIGSGDMRESSDAPLIGSTTAAARSVGARTAARSDPPAPRGAMRSAHVARYRLGPGGHEASNAPLSSAPLSSAPLSSGPPSSAPAAVISVRARSTAAVHQLERLGLLTRKRPFAVALGVMLGAAAIAFTMKLGSEAVLALQRGVDRSVTPPRAQQFAHTTPFCGSGNASAHSVKLERDICRWLTLTWTAPKLVASQPSSVGANEAVRVPASTEPTVAPTTRAQ
ncbi:MAG TPA: hypothetical protein VIV60_29300 [Polyangiaceae bacterium]